MLINVRENNLQGVARHKNLYWESRGITPNEAYTNDPRYKRFVKNFALKNRLGATESHRFWEVRIIKQKPSAIERLQKNWWEDTLFMDQVFWMFQRPLAEEVDGQCYQYYALEPFECWRVINAGIKKFGHRPTKQLTDAFIIPVECCQVAWNETSAGVSDHIHYRPDVILSQRQIDKRAMQTEATKKLLHQAVNIADDPKWEENIELVEKKLTKDINGPGTT